MNISKSRLVQIIKEEIENMRKEQQDLELNVSEYERVHEGESCAEAHGGLSHKEWASGKRGILMPEELQELQEESN
tara:strand:+ start:751 stop:978 length:228 start_codon:yes stop_codon:yes gene_type:complete